MIDGMNEDNMLSDDELSGISGGAGKKQGKDPSKKGDPNAPRKVKKYCEACKAERTFFAWSGDRYTCSKCGYRIEGPDTVVV